MDINGNYFLPSEESVSLPFVANNSAWILSADNWLLQVCTPKGPSWPKNEKDKKMY